MKTDKANIDLHVHPIYGFSPSDIFYAMSRTGLDAIAISAYNKNTFPEVAQKLKDSSSKAIADNKGVIAHDNVIFNAREYNTKEGLHVLTVGHSFETPEDTEIRKIIDTALENDALILLDHPYVDNKETRTAGHISPDLASELEKICSEYSEDIAIEWNAYCIPWMRAVLKTGLNIAGKKTDYHDVNKMAIILSEHLKEKFGYNIPVIASTDLHARKPRDLLKMGTSRIITDIEGKYPEELLASMKKNVFAGNYEAVCRYVSGWHLLSSFCLPIVLPKFYENPRA